MTRADTSIRLVPEAQKNEWDAIVLHPLQSWAWGEFRKSMGIDIVRLGVYKTNVLTDGWQISFHPIPHTPYTIGNFPKGPLPTKEMVNALFRIGKQKKALFIQLEPNVIRDSRLTINDLRLKPSHHPLFTKYTFILDLTKSEEELLKAMSQKTRYNIKVAQKHNVRVQEDHSKKAFDEYLRLSQETTTRQGFYAHNATYHKRMWEFLHKANIAHLFNATRQGKTLASWICFVWNDTIYYPYGASSRDFREAMAPNLLLWEVALWAKRLGIKYFDLWGAIGPTPNPNDPWYGFHRFKEGYHPDLVQYIGSYDLIIHPLLYQLYKVADTARWFFLKHRVS